MRIAIPIILILYGGCGMVAAGVLPIDEVAGKPLTYVAKEALPTVIFWIFYLGGAMGALLTSLNSSFGFYANMFAGGAEDGWLPEIFARKNKHGAYYFVLTLGYVIGLLPIIFRFPVEAVTSNMMFVNALLMCLAYIAAWKLPSKYPELWNNSLTKMPVGVFHVIMVFSFLMEAATVVYSAMSSNIFALVVSILIMIISVFYAGYRLKAGKVKSKASIWFD